MSAPAAAACRTFCKLRRTSSFSHALFRTAEAVHLPQAPLVPPVLDFGCGDGSLAAACFRQRIDIGIDAGMQVLARAKRAACYDDCVLADGARLPLADGSIGSVLSVSVFEHLRRPAEALAELFRVLRPGGMLVATIALAEIHRNLYWPGALERLKLSWLAAWYRRTADRIFGHCALFDADEWRRLLIGAGFELMECRPIVSPALVARWDRGLPAAAMGAALQWMKRADEKMKCQSAVGRRSWRSAGVHRRRFRHFRVLRSEWHAARQLIFDDTQPCSALFVIGRKPSPES